MEACFKGTKKWVGEKNNYFDANKHSLQISSVKMNKALNVNSGSKLNNYNINTKNEF